MNREHQIEKDCHEVSIFQTDLETHFRKNRINGTNYYSLLKMQQILETVYPNEWDIRLKFSKVRQLVYTNTYGGNHNKHIYKYRFIISSVNIIIHFPEITISNTRQESRVLHDIYFKISMYCIKDSYLTGDYYNRDPDNDDYKVIHKKEVYNTFLIDQELKGLRTTISTLETLTGYVHSHLKHNSYKYATFCLGSGEILDYMSNLSSGFDEDIFMGFILQVRNFLEHESLEGKPYRYISRIVNKEDPQIMNDTHLLRFYKHFKENCTADQLNQLEWSYKGDKAILIENNKLWSIVTENVKQYESGVFLVNRDIKGKEFRINVTANTDLDQYLGIFDFPYNIYFKNERLKYTVIPETQIVLQSANELSAPKVAVNYIKEKLEQIVYEKRLDSHRNAKFNIVSDPQ